MRAARLPAAACSDYPHREPAARDMPVDRVANRGFQHLHLPRSVTEISVCLRFTELSSTVILKPSCEHSPRP